MRIVYGSAKKPCAPTPKTSAGTAMKVYAVWRSPPSRNQVTSVPKRRPPRPPLVELAQVAAAPAGRDEAQDRDRPEEQAEDGESDGVGLVRHDRLSASAPGTPSRSAAAIGTHANWYQ
jgi:hypothetical protein